MSFFKIEKSGCHVRNGLLQVRYDQFWEETAPSVTISGSSCPRTARQFNSF